MSQIEDLQARITRALDRIGQGIDGMDRGPAQEEFDALRGRAEAAEDALAQTQEALAATREQAEMDRDAAVAAVRAELAEELERARAEAQAAGIPQPVDSGAPDLADMQAALDDEQMANAQLEERLRVLKARLAEAEAAAGAPSGPPSMQALDAELQKLRAANEELMAANASLREANAQGVGDAQLINRGLAAELSALKATRAADAAEASAVMDALTPLLAEAAEGTQP